MERDVQTPQVKFTMRDVIEPIRREEMELELKHKQNTAQKSLIHQKLFILNNQKSKVERLNMTMIKTRN